MDIKKIGLLGATGNVGKQVVQVVKKYDQKIVIDFIALYQNVDELKRLLQTLPINKVVIVGLKTCSLSEEFPQVKFSYGVKALHKMISTSQVSLVVNAISGFAGLQFTLDIIKAKQTLALANKESLVVAGKQVMDLAIKNQVKIIPIDSEHAAIFQCLLGEEIKAVKKIILTASGGPFLNASDTFLTKITPKDALNHPVWNMSIKISVDSATMFNKALEIIEAHWLFNQIPIEVVVHPQSIIHSLVEFTDGSIKAQLSNPTMELPIQAALTFPEKWPGVKPLDISKEMILNFTKIAPFQKPVLALAYEAIKRGGSYPVVLNAANEVAVKKFLNHEINFLDIYKFVKKELDSYKHKTVVSLTEVFAINDAIKMKGLIKCNL